MLTWKLPEKHWNWQLIIVFSPSFTFAEPSHAFTASTNVLFSMKVQIAHYDIVQAWNEYYSSPNYRKGIDSKKKKKKNSLFSIIANESWSNGKQYRITISSMNE